MAKSIILFPGLNIANLISRASTIVPLNYIIYKLYFPIRARNIHKSCPPLFEGHAHRRKLRKEREKSSTQRKREGKHGGKSMVPLPFEKKER